MKISKLKQMFSETKSIKNNSKIANFLEDEITSIVSKEGSPYSKSATKNNLNFQHNNQNYNSSNINPHQYQNFSNNNFTSDSYNQDKNFHSHASFHNQHNYNDFDSQLPQQPTFRKSPAYQQQDLILEENSYRILKPIIENWLAENLEVLTEKIIRKELKKYLESDEEEKYLRDKHYQFDFQDPPTNHQNKDDYLRDKFLKETRERIRYKYEK